MEGLHKIRSIVRSLINESDKTDILINKIGVSKEIADWATKLDQRTVNGKTIYSDKYSIWIANSLKADFINGIVNPEEKELVIRVLNNASDREGKNYKNAMIQLLNHARDKANEYKYVLDWLKGRNTLSIETDNINFKELTLDQAISRSDAWHDKIEEIQGGQIKDEDGDVVLTFPNGFYWINLNKSYCGEEAKAMGHCGRGAGDLYSLRNDKYPYVTADVSDGIIYQMRGRANTKPKSDFHSYIVSLIMDKNLDIKYFEYNNYKRENNFFIHDLSGEEIDKIVKEKPILLNNQDFELLDLTSKQVNELLTKMPWILPLKTIYNSVGKNGFKELLKNSEFVNSMIHNDKINEYVDNASSNKELSDILAKFLYENNTIKAYLFNKEENIQSSINNYIQLLKKTGNSGITYIRKILLETDEIEKIFIKNGDLMSYVQILVNKDNMIPGGIQLALNKMKSPNFKSLFIN